MLAENTVFYQIYPLGFCGAPDRNPFDGQTAHRLNALTNQIPSLKRLGINAVYLCPVFNATAHGYDTADYYRIDTRLGTNEEFAHVCKAYHDAGIAVVLDGVFNHVGRDFAPFKDVRENGKNSKYADWFFIQSRKNSPYNDGFYYRGWEGYYDLVKLNLKNPAVKTHLLGAVEMWIKQFDIDGLRLDVAYCLDKTFIEELRARTNALKKGFFLLGEVLHGDYADYLSEKRLDSVINYDLYDALFAGINRCKMQKTNACVLAQQERFGNIPLYNFADNHDVSRVASKLKNDADARLLYTLIFVLNGIPSVYYQSEYGVKADKKQGDKALRPADKPFDETDLTRHIQKLCAARKNHPVMRAGTYIPVIAKGGLYAFCKKRDGHTLFCAVNVSNVCKNVMFEGKKIRIRPHESKVTIDGRDII